MRDQLKPYLKRILQSIKNERLADSNCSIDEKKVLIYGEFTPTQIKKIYMNSNQDSKSREIQRVMTDYWEIKNGVPGKYKSSMVNTLFDILQSSENLLGIIVDNEVSKDALEAFEILKELGNSYIVGGFIRNILLGKEFHDIDVVTDADYQTIKKTFENNNWSANIGGLLFATLKVKKNDTEIDITNFRKDGTYDDGRHPTEVTIGTFEEDAERRDFTVNCMYYSLNDFRLHDPTGVGLKDIIDRRLEFIGKADDRVHEDLLRVFRFYRFVSNGFKPTPNSLAAARKGLKCAMEKLPADRVRMELEKTVGL